jgi:hypothetical protein
LAIRGIKVILKRPAQSIISRRVLYLPIDDQSAKIIIKFDELISRRSARYCQ